MSCRKMMLGLVVSGLVTVLTAGMAFAQAGGGAPAGTGGGGGFGAGGFGGGGRQGRGNFMDNMKQQLGVTDDAEWTVLQQKLEPVMRLSREAHPSFFGGMNRRPRQRGGEQGDNAAATQPTQKPSELELADKTKALNDALENKDAAAQDIVQKLAAVRDARERVKADLAAAQKDLKELLSAKQEARLVLMGLLD